MQQVAALASSRPSRLARWFWSLTLALIGFVVSLAAWDYVNALLARSPIMGGLVTGLLVLLVGVLGIICLRELAAFGRLRKLDRIQHNAIQHTRRYAYFATHDRMNGVRFGENTASERVLHKLVDSRRQGRSSRSSSSTTTTTILATVATVATFLPRKPVPDLGRVGIKERTELNQCPRRGAH